MLYLVSCSYLIYTSHRDCGEQLFHAPAEQTLLKMTFKVDSHAFVMLASVAIEFHMRFE